MKRLVGKGRVESCELVVRGSAVDPETRHRDRMASFGQEDPAVLEHREVGEATTQVALHRGEQAREERGAEVRLLVGERVRQPDHGAARVVGREPERVQRSRTDEGVGPDLGQTGRCDPTGHQQPVPPP